MRADPRQSMPQYRARLHLAAWLVLLVPVIALAVLAMRYLEARGTATAEAERLHWQHLAETEARALSARADATAQDVAHQLMSAYRSRGPDGLRSAYLARPDLAMAALFDGAGQMLYPETRELSIYAEEHYLRAAALDLAEARRQADGGGLAWAGRASAAGGLVVACMPAAEGIVCPVFRSTALLPGPGWAHPAAIGDGARAGHLALALSGAADPAAVSVALSGPYAGLAVTVDYPVERPRDWAGLALTVGPALIATAIALWLLRRAQRAEVAAERYRRVLLAEMSHELRTPLTNIGLYAALIARGAGEGAEPARLQRHAETIRTEVRNLGVIVENALTVAATGALPGGALVPADPDATVLNVVERFRPSLGLAAPPTLSLQAGGMAAFDLASFERVLVNLLDNVRRHAPGTALHISTRREGARLVLCLQDTGPGAAVPRPVASGFGIGLDACRRMGAAAGGRFDAVIAPGGSRFTLELPLGAVPQEAVRCVS